MIVSKKVFLTLLFSTLFIITNCESETGALSSEAEIGGQVWMTQNLNSVTFRNGDPIPHAQSSDEWREAGDNREPAWSYYNNDPENGERYGLLYNWYAVNDPRALAPEGWRIPGDEEWAELVNYLGGEETAATELQSRDGFYALPGGYRGLNEQFNGMNDNIYWWSATELGEDHAHFWPLNLRTGTIRQGSLQKRNGHYVRLLKE